MTTATTTSSHQTIKEQVAVYEAIQAELNKARAKGAKTAELNKLSGRLGTPMTKIRAAELELAQTDEAFTPYVPKRYKVRYVQDIGTQAEVQAKLQTLRATAEKEGQYPTVVKSAKGAIKALLAAAELRGLQVS